tara:strand:- start:4657 stop:6318 length:1662 start_codon:yes stop_codon:yes gene_type:complete
MSKAVQQAQSLLASSRGRAKKSKRQANVLTGAALFFGATDYALRQRAIDRAGEFYSSRIGEINELNNTVRTGVDFWANERTRQNRAELDSDLWEEGLYAERVRADLKLGADVQSGLSQKERTTYINNLREDEEFQKYITEYGQLREQLAEFKPVDNEKLEEVQNRFTGQTQANLDLVYNQMVKSGGLVGRIGSALGISDKQVEITRQEIEGGVTRFNIPEDATDEQRIFYTELNTKLNQTAGLSDDIKALSIFKQNLSGTPLTGRGNPSTDSVGTFRNIITQASEGDPSEFTMFVSQDDDIQETKALKNIMLGGTEYNLMEILKTLDTNQNALLKEDLAYLSGVMKDNVEEFGVDSALITNDEYILFALQHLSTTENLEVVKRGEPTALAERFGIGINLSYKQLTTQEKNILANTAPKALLNRITTLEDVSMEDLQDQFTQNTPDMQMMGVGDYINEIEYFKANFDNPQDGINEYLATIRENIEEFRFLNQYEEVNGLPVIDYSIDNYMLLREHIKGLYSNPITMDMKRKHNEYFTMLDSLRLNPSLINDENY